MKIARESNKPSTPTTIVDTIASMAQTINANAPYILLVEDNLIALNILESLTKASGCRFESAIDGEQALKLATTHEFNFILTDIGLPGISGHEFTERFRKWAKTHKKKAIPVICLTAHLRNKAIKECLVCGMDNVYTKPATMAIIQSILKEYYLQGREIAIQNPQPQDEPKLARSRTLGKDLPDTEDDLFIMDKFLVFSPKTALEYVEDEAILLKALNIFLSDDVQQDIHKMTIAYKKKNWGDIERLAHKLKGGLGYTGLLRMGYACQYLDRYYKAGHRDLKVLEKLYHQVINVNQESIKEVKSWINKFKLK